MMRIDTNLKPLTLPENPFQSNQGLQKNLLERLSSQPMTNVADDSTTSVEERFRSQSMVKVGDGSATSRKVIQQPGINSQSDGLGVNKVNASKDNISISSTAIGKANLQDTLDNMKKFSDVDVSKQSMELTKNQVLMQASTAMMAQANSSPQVVLQLLR